MYDCSSVPLIAILLFCGELRIARNGKLVIINKWIQFKVDERHAVLLKKIQQEIDFVLRKKVELPFSDITEEQYILRSLMDILVDSDLT